MERHKIVIHGDTFDDKKAELVAGGMSASDAHQAAYRCVLQLRQDPIHRKILTAKRVLPEDDDYEPKAAMRYAVSKTKISDMNSRWLSEWWRTWGWRWWKWMNLNRWKNEQIEPWAIMGNEEHMILASNMNYLFPHFLPIMGGKMGQYAPKMSKMDNIPPQGAKTRGYEICSLYSYTNLRYFLSFDHPRNGGIAKDSKVMHNLWTKFVCVYLDFVDEVAIMEQQGRFGSIEWYDVLDLD